MKIMKARKPTLLFIFPFLLFGLLHLSKAALTDYNLNFTFPPFNSSVQRIVLEGNATASNNEIQLTIIPPDMVLHNKIGRATYYEPMHLWDNSSGNLVLADFTSQFSFVIDFIKNEPKGDGFAFFLAPNDSKMPPQSAGGFLGLESRDVTYKFNSNFVAVEFDTFHNDWDPSGMSEHVAIDINSVKSFSAVNWSDFANGGKVDAFISYDSSTKNLCVFLHYADDLTYKNSSSLNEMLDLSQYLPEWVTFGFSGSTGDSFEIPSILSWNFSSSLEIDDSITDPVASPHPEPNVHSKRRWKNRTGLAVGLGVAGALVAMVSVWLASLYRRKFGKDEDNGHVIDEEIEDEFERGTGPKKFSYNELAHATDNFKDAGKLGQGGFGGVYKGFLADSSSYVAVKRVLSGSKQGIKEYASEVKIISRLRHRNLVQLIGWCHDKKELLLVYEFMPNGSLDSHLFTENNLLTWEARYKIALGLASGLLYLHEGWEQCVVDRDIKSSNVLLDSDFNAKLGDFGLARLVDHAKGSQTTVLAGTMGYLAPECHIAGKASKQSDVYSFGVVALEIACGRKPIDLKAGEGKVNLVEWVWELYGKGKLLEACDRRLCGEFVKQQMEQLMTVGLWCAHPDENSRPPVQQAIHALNFEVPLPILPSKMPVPTYYAPPLNFHAFSLSYSGTNSGGLRNQFSSNIYSTNSSQFTSSSTSSASATASLLLAPQV